MTAAPAGFPPHVLRKYALLADGQRGAVIGSRGDVAWRGRGVRGDTHPADL